MLIQYADSDSWVKPSTGSESESCANNAATLVFMGSDEEPLAAYVRKRIAEWEASGKTLKELRDAAGMGKSSMVNQIKAGSSVSETTGAKLAGPLGFSNYFELVEAAYRWKFARTELGRDEFEGPSPLTDAIKLATKYGITTAQIDRGLARIPEEFRANVDALAWLAIFHDERSIDARIDGELRAAAHTAKVAERAREQKQQEIQAATQQKKVRPRKARRIA